MDENNNIVFDSQEDNVTGISPDEGESTHHRIPMTALITAITTTIITHTAILRAKEEKIKN